MFAFKDIYQTSFFFRYKNTDFNKRTPAKKYLNNTDMEYQKKKNLKIVDMKWLLNEEQQSLFLNRLNRLSKILFLLPHAGNK